LTQANSTDGSGDGKRRLLYETVLSDEDRTAVPLGRQGVLVNINRQTLLVKFKAESDQKTFIGHILPKKPLAEKNYFECRTEESSSVQYFQFYGYLR